MAKKFFIKSTATTLKKEVDQLRVKVQTLETMKETTTAKSTATATPRRPKRTAIYSPPTEVDAKIVELDFETDDELFTVKK